MDLKNVKIDQLEHEAIQDKVGEPFINTLVKRLIYTLSKDKYAATERDYFLSTAYAVKDHLVSRWIKTQQEYYHKDVKRIYYLSMEFLTGRALSNSLINLGMYDSCKDNLTQIGLDLEELAELEADAGLGNGGLGRLAACFMDSMATLQLPAYGYGIRYEYGIFYQRLRDGYQVEAPDNWLRYPNPWEIERPEHLYTVNFYGRVNQYMRPDGGLACEWVDTLPVMAMAFDTPIPGYGNNTVNTFRLWSSKSSRDFDLQYFNRGDYLQAVEDKAQSETISKVLYPEDSTLHGKELRLKQEYFFISASLQDILRRYDKMHSTIDQLPDKIAIQLNDTHPALAVVELMRILVDERRLTWEKAWDITKKVFAYTNHTILPEAVERWKVSMLEYLLPRHLQIIYEINRRFLDEVWIHNPGDHDRLRRMSIVEETPEKKIHMGHLCIVGSHSINGVSELHTNILKNRTFREFHELYPERFSNKTNGITQRRWLLMANRRLTKLISEYIGDGFTTDLYQLKKLIPYADDPDFQQKWREVKAQNKLDFAAHVKHICDGAVVDPQSMFDFHVKRMHEYKRQLLRVMHVVHMYNTIRQNPQQEFTPRTIFFAGKAAPGYAAAKLVIKLVTSVGHLINNDPLARGKLQVLFLPNYSVSLAERIFPAADLSEQIATAGMEASGTGNMKFALNGALTIGTMDGANVEMLEEFGAENIFIFGLQSHEVEKFRGGAYNPMDYYNRNESLRKVVDMIGTGFFCPSQPDLFRSLMDALLYHGDYYCLLADFESFVNCQQQVSETYQDQRKWTRMAILNVANCGKFSSDRSIKQYAEEIWNVSPVPISMDL